MKKYVVQKKGKNLLWLDEHDGIFIYISPNTPIHTKFTDKELAERLAKEFGGKVKEIKDE